MTDKEKKEKFLKSYVGNHGILSEALKESGISAKDYNKFMEAPLFAEEVKSVELLQDDLVLSKFLSLVKNGDPRAIIEARKMQKERKEGLDVLELKTKAMIYFTNKAETKSEILEEFCDWFNVAESTAESFYKKTKTEHRLESPHQRKKKAEMDYNNRLDVLLAKREIDEVRMIEILLIKQAKIVEEAVYPSEVSKATQEITNLTRRISELKAEKLREQTLSNERLCDVLDSELMGISIDKVKELTEYFNGGKLLEDSHAL